MIKPTEEQVKAIKLASTNRTFKLSAAAGAAKSQPVWATVQTPTGPRQIGSLVVGDYVFGANGKPTKVIGVFPQGIKQTYEVKFRDGSTTWCSEDHLWAVKRRNYPKNGYKVVTLGDMLSDGLVDSSGSMKYKTPLAEAVQYEEKPHLIHPYVLGWMLGDGYLCGNTPAVSVAKRDSEALSILCKLLPEGYKMNTRKTSENCYQATILHENGRGGVVNGIAREIYRLGLAVKSAEKFIPVDYLQDSVENRLSLLRGLMDTDGSISSNRVTFSSTSTSLISGVTTLARSLGFVVVQQEAQHKDRDQPLYCLNIKATVNPFMISTKANKWKLSSKNPPSKYIKSSTVIGMDEHVCIKVEAEDSLYLTDEFNVTHNTTTCELIAKENPVKSLYLAFNRSMAEEAAGRFPSHVEVRTTHSLAYKTFGQKYRQKLSRPLGGYVNVAKTGSEVARLLKIPTYMIRSTGEAITASSLGNCVIATVARFEHSADKELKEKHISLSGIPQKKQTRVDFPEQKLRQEVFKAAKKLWDLRVDTSSPVMVTHDTYLKLYQLSSPDLSAYEIIYLDEYQDTNDCVHSIAMMQNKSKLVAVGDRFQAIYGFRGSVNAMEKLDWEEGTLSQSFRFGQSVADLANIILRDQKTFQFQTDIKGNPSKDTKVLSRADWQPEAGKPYTKLYRTNANLIADAVEDIQSGKVVAIETDLGNFVRCLESGVALYQGQKAKVKHDMFQGFENWAEFVEECEFDKECARIKRIVLEGEVNRIVDVLANYVQPKDYEVKYSTAHKSKGLEYDIVLLADDFPSPINDDGNWVGLTRDEQNLLYVAATRAKEVLIINEAVELMLDHKETTEKYQGLQLRVNSVRVSSPPFFKKDVNLDTLVEVEMVRLAGANGLMSDLDKFIEGSCLHPDDDHWQNMDMEFQGLPN